MWRNSVEKQNIPRGNSLEHTGSELCYKRLLDISLHVFEKIKMKNFYAEKKLIHLSRQLIAGFVTCSFILMEYPLKIIFLCFTVLV